ncbi:MAG: hypothetical protein FWD46_06240 [Cystobacterineae bacterium]|nr:hypothetical protein [Cystobacterineae bacterium]
MKTNTFFTVGIFPLLLAAFYAGEAGAQTFSISVNGRKDLDYRNNQTTGVLPYPYNSLSLMMNIANVAGTAGSSYRILNNDDVECRLRRVNPDGSETELGGCGTLSSSWAGALNGATRTYTQIPVPQGLYVVSIHATARNNNANNFPPLTSELEVSWFVHSQNPPPPIARNMENGNVLAIAGDNGICDPVVIPIIAEHYSMLYYSIDGGPQQNVADRLDWSQTLGGILHGARYVDYNLELTDTMLGAGDTLSLRLWHEDHLGYGRSTLNPAVWTIECPRNGTAVLGEGPPAKSYSPEATFKFSVSGTTGTARTFCSIDDAHFESCTSSYTASGLRAGAHVFRVYAGSAQGPRNDGDIVEHRWVVSAPDVHFLETPSDGSNTTAVFKFETVRENGVLVPGEFWCSVDGGIFFECNSPWPVGNLNVGRHQFEVYAENELFGEGVVVQHSWEIWAPEQPREKTQNPLGLENDGDGCSGCSTAANLPLSLAALAGLWALRRRRS